MSIFGDPAYKNVTGETSLQWLWPGSVLRFTVTYVGDFKHLGGMIVGAFRETFKQSVEAYPASIRDATKGALTVVSIAPVRVVGTGGDSVAVFDVQRGSDSGAPDITLAQLVEAIDRYASSAEVTRIELLDTDAALDPKARAQSLQREHDQANPGSSDTDPGVPYLPTPKASFGAEFGKYAGVVFAIAVLVGGAYFLRTFKD